MRKYYSLATLVVVAIIGGIVYWNIKTRVNKVDNNYSIPVILPLSGNLSHIGESEQRGLELAEDSINKAGGINGRKLELAFQDSRGSAKDGVSAWQNILTTGKPELVIATISGVCQALSPLANNEKVVLLASDCTGAKYTSSGDYTFRVVSSNAREGEFMAEHLIQEGVYSVAILKILNEYGEGIFGAFQSKYIALGGKIKAVESYQPEQREFSTEVVKLINSRPDAIYLMTYSPENPTILKHLKDLQVVLPIYAGETFDNQASLKAAGSLAEGVIFPRNSITTSTTGDSFVKEYETRYGVRPDINAARTYDALAVAAAVVSECDKQRSLTSSCVQRKLDEIKYQGLTGVIDFDNNGDVQLIYYLKTIRDGKSVYVTPQ